MTPRVACPVGAMLGEGPVWIARERALWFVDIKAPKVHRFLPGTGALESWDAPEQVGWILPSRAGDFLVGLQSGIHRFDPIARGFSAHAVPAPHPPTNRLNDATTDAAGRLWFGTMDDGEAALTGRLFRHHGGETRDSGLAPVAITNGPAFAPDFRTLYHTDTLGRAIHAVPVDADGRLGTAKVFAQIEDGAGYPDGSSVDSAGNVWTGLYGGWAARCYSPDGLLTTEVRFPTANVTKVAFGGDDLKTAYTTTARKGLTRSELAAQPKAGHLFTFTVDTPGQPAYEVAV